MVVPLPLAQEYRKFVDFSNMSVSQLTFFCHSAAASLASPHNNKDTMSHPSLLFHLTCEPIKHMANVVKSNQLQEK